MKDLRFTIRMLAARPGWTVGAILRLGIATGANTAAFTLVNGLLLRPLPFDEPKQLVMVASREPEQAAARPFALQEYRELAAQADARSLLLARTFFPLSLAAGDGARMAQAELVSGNCFETLRSCARGLRRGNRVALWLTQALVARLTTPFHYVSYAIDMHPDARVFPYSAIATAAAAVLCGIAPIRLAQRQFVGAG